MNDTLGVSGVQRVGNLNGQVEQSLVVQRPACNDAVLECLAFQELHHDEGLALCWPIS